jgi:hypothetical protein
MLKKLCLALAVCMVILAILAVWLPSLASELLNTFWILGVVLFIVFLWALFSSV